MNVLIVGLIAAAAVLAQTALAGAMQIGQVTPSLIALAALAWQLAGRGRYRFLGAGAIALAGELFAPGRIGAGAASMLVVAYALGGVQERLRIDHPAVQVPLVGAGTAAWVVGTGALRRLAGDASPSLVVLVEQAPAVAAYTAAVALPLLLVIAWTRPPHGSQPFGAP